MPKSLLWRLVVSYVLAVGCFVGSTLYSEAISRSVSDAALSIATNAMPSIENLTNTRAELRQLDLALSRYAETRSLADREEVMATRTRIESAFERYLGLPVYPGERLLMADMHHSLAAVERTVDDVLAGRVVDPHDTFAGAMNAATESVRRTVDFNADRGRELAIRIERGHKHAWRAALLLDLLSTLFTALAAFFTLRTLAHYSRVVDERNRLAARRAEELEMFAGRVAHDVLGPLSATRMAIGFVSGRIDEPVLRRSLDRGERGIARVAVIVDGLLRFARAGAQPEPGVSSALAPVLEGVIGDLQPLAAEAHITLTLHAPPSCRVFGHAGVIASVVENLVRNAIKYMGDAAERRIDVRVAAREQRVRIEVTDTGPGIAPSLLETIFDPHVRGKTHGQPGIGLGLATVKRIVESHGGSVGVRSRLGGGSTFWCELPRADYDDDSRACLPSAQVGKQSL